VKECRVLRKIFVLKMDELTGYCRRLHNEELYALYSSPHVIQVIKSRKMRWVEHVASMGQMKGAYRFWWRDLIERDHLIDLGVGGRIVLK
jgi:hypothetical protein